jgi:hypothetical protein
MLGWEKRRVMDVKIAGGSANKKAGRNGPA